MGEVVRAFILAAIGAILGGCTKNEAIQESKVHGYKVRLYKQFRVSDPEYLFMEINGVLVFKCRGGTKGEFAGNGRKIKVLTDCNYQYGYDGLMRKQFEVLELEYAALPSGPRN